MEKEHKHNQEKLCICCIHIKRGFPFHFRGKDVLCNECWKIYDLLNFQYNGNIPNDVFMNIMGKYIITSCEDCILEVTGGI
jgi:hypothetical protein